MSDYLLIESRDPFDSGCSHYHELAESLVAGGSRVTLFLVQNGVFPARQCNASARLTEVAGKGVEVLVDDFSLKERGIDSAGLAAGVKVASLEVVMDQLEQGRKVLWH